MAEHAHTTDRRTPEAAAPAPGRRSLLTASIALSLAGAGATLAAPAAPHPDEALLRLGERLVVSSMADAAAYALADGEKDDEGPLTLAAEAQQARTSKIVAEIEQQTATTHAGLIVKLRAVLWCMGAPCPWDREGCTNERILATIWDDMSAMDVVMRGVR